MKTDSYGMKKEPQIIPLRSRATIDTIELFYPRPPRLLRKRLQGKLGRRVRIKPCLDKTDHQRGVRACINRPNKDVLFEIAAILRDHPSGCICRCDLAFDFTLPNQRAADALAEYLDRHLLLKWRPTGALKEHYRSTIYWAQDNRSRNLAMYHKRESILRLELRFLNSASVKRAGLEDPAKIEVARAADLLAKNIRLLSFKESHVHKSIRRSIREDRHKNLKRLRDGAAPDDRSGFRDRYRSSIAARDKSLFDKMDMQGFVSINGTRFTEKLPLDFLKLPETVEW